MDPTGLRPAVKRRRRDVKGVKYYFIDFGTSTRFEDDVPFEDRRVTGTDCQGPDVPELSRLIPYGPFAVDVFILGNVYRQDFLSVSKSRCTPWTHNSTSGIAIRQLIISFGSGRVYDGPQA